MPRHSTSVNPREEGQKKEKKEGKSDADPRLQDEAWRVHIPVLCLDQQTPRVWAMKTHAHEPPPEMGGGCWGWHTNGVRFWATWW